MSSHERTPAVLAYPTAIVTDLHGVDLRVWNAVTRNGVSLALLVGGVAPRGVVTTEQLQVAIAELLEPTGDVRRVRLPAEKAALVTDISFARQRQLFG